MGNAAEQAMAPVSRRRFLRWTLLGAAAGATLLGGGLALLARSPRDAEPLPAGITSLTSSEYRLFHAVCVANLPDEHNARGLTAWVSLPVLQNIDGLIADAPTHLRGDISAALALLDHLPILDGFHGRRFVDLEPDVARAYLRACGNGGEIARAISNLARRLAFVAYWQEPATWPPVGYDGPVSARWGLPRLGNAPMPATETTNAAWGDLT